MVIDEADAVAQIQLALLEALNLQEVRAWGIVQGLDRSVEVAMLLPQPPKRLLKLPPVLFAKARRGRTPCPAADTLAGAVASLDYRLKYRPASTDSGYQKTVNAASQVNPASTFSDTVS